MTIFVCPWIISFELVITGCKWRTVKKFSQIAVSCVNTEGPFYQRILVLIEYLPLQVDIHLHCDEWDRALDDGNWEPQQIASKLSNFLQFLRRVQPNLSP